MAYHLSQVIDRMHVFCLKNIHKTEFFEKNQIMENVSWELNPSDWGS
jgi:hypothetical protein